MLRRDEKPKQLHLCQLTSEEILWIICSWIFSSFWILHSLPYHDNIISTVTCAISHRTFNIREGRWSAT